MTEAKEVEKLPEGWKRVRLGEVIKQIKCVAPRGSKPYLEIGDIDINSKAYSITEKVAPNHCLKAKEDNIIISKVRPTRGAIARIRETDIFVSPALLVIEYKEPSFLFFVISRQKFFKHLGTLETGTTYPSVNDNDILSYEFDIPIKISEQRKIAEILESVDNAIEKTDRIIEKYKSIKQGLMQDLLTKGIDENGQIRSEETHKFKDSPLGRIPEEWEVVELGEVAKIVNGFTFPLSFQGKDLGMYPFIKVGDLNLSYKYIERADNYIDEDDRKKLSLKIYPKGTLIFPKIGMAVYLNKFRILRKESTFDNNVAGVVPINVIDEFIYYYFRAKVDLRKIASETALPSIKKSTLENLKITCPPFPEQRKIAEILSTIDNAIEKEQAYKEKLERIKHGLMEDLLTGKIRVNHLIEVGIENVSQV